MKDELKRTWMEAILVWLRKTLKEPVRIASAQAKTWVKHIQKFESRALPLCQSLRSCDFQFLYLMCDSRFEYIEAVPTFQHTSSLRNIHQNVEALQHMTRLNPKPKLLTLTSFRVITHDTYWSPEIKAVSQEGFFAMGWSPVNITHLININAKVKILSITGRFICNGLVSCKHNTININAKVKSSAWCWGKK
jgi:hypothetical protein